MQFHNANLFGSCIIHILYTGCAKIKKNNSGAKGLTLSKPLLGKPGIFQNMVPRLKVVDSKCFNDSKFNTKTVQVDEHFNMLPYI